MIGGLQQARFIVEMKRAHADARHRGHLFDCVSHRLFSAETTLVPAAALHSQGSRNVRVKKKRKVGIPDFRQEDLIASRFYASNIAASSCISKSGELPRIANFHALKRNTRKMCLSSGKLQRVRVNNGSAVPDLLTVSKASRPYSRDRNCPSLADVKGLM